MAPESAAGRGKAPESAAGRGKRGGAWVFVVVFGLASGAGACGERRGTAAPEDGPALVAESVAGSGEVAGVDGATAAPGTEIKDVQTLPAGVDAGELGPMERATLAEILREQFDPCGKPRTFQAALEAADGCDEARRLAASAVARLRDGLNKKQVVAHLLGEMAKRARRVDFDLEGVPCTGEARPGQRIVVEFSDFQCPHCAAVFAPAKSLVERHGARLCAKQLPLPAHPHARNAALAALAAHRQGQFWPYAETVYARQASLSEEMLVTIARELKLDLQRFDADRRGAAVAEELARDMAEADLAQIDGTPTFFVDGELVPFEDLEMALTAPRVE